MHGGQVVGGMDWLFGDASEFILLERFAHTGPHRGMPFDIRLLVFRPLANTVIAGVTPLSPPCNSACACVTSGTLPAVATTEWTTPVVSSTPMWAFNPKCQSLPFFDWCISGSRSPSRFMVEGGAAIKATSTLVSSRIVNPFPAQWPLISSNGLGCHRLHLPHLRPTDQSTVAQCACAACAPDQWAGGRAHPPWGRQARWRPPAPAKASLPRSRQEGGRVSFFLRHTRRQKSSIASSQW